MPRFVRTEELDGLAAALEAAPLALIATDLAGTITHWSRHAEELYGWRADEVVGTSIMTVTVGPLSRAVAESIMAAVTAGGAWSGEFTARRRDGSQVDVHVIDLPLRDDTGQAGVVGLSVDVTRERDVLVAEAAAEQAISRAELRYRQAERARLARELHDDLGQYLTMLRTEVLGVAERDGGPPRALLDRLVGLADAGLERLHHIIADLDPGELRGGGLGEALATQLEDLRGRTGITTTIEVDYRPLESPYDRGLFSIAQSLLTNCERHARATRVDVRLVDDGETVVLEIRDDGIGIPDDANGFGLASARTRARELGASLTIARASGGGTVATLTLPGPPRVEAP